MTPARIGRFPSPPPWLRKAMAVGLLAALIASVWMFVVHPLAAAYMEREEKLRSDRELLGRYVAIAGLEDEVSAFDAERRASTDLSEFLQGDASTIAAANLQTRLKTISRTSSAAFRSARPLEEKEQDGVALIGVRIHVTGDIVAVQQILHQIEYGLPFMFIEAAQVSQSRQNRRSDQQSAPQLDLRLDIYAPHMGDGIE